MDLPDVWIDFDTGGPVKGVYINGERIDGIVNLEVNVGHYGSFNGGLTTVKFEMNVASITFGKPPAEAADVDPVTNRVNPHALAIRRKRAQREAESPGG